MSMLDSARGAGAGARGRGGRESGRIFSRSNNLLSPSFSTTTLVLFSALLRRSFTRAGSASSSLESFESLESDESGLGWIRLEPPVGAGKDRDEVVGESGGLLVVVGKALDVEVEVAKEEVEVWAKDEDVETTSVERVVIGTIARGKVEGTAVEKAVELELDLCGRFDSDDDAKSGRGVLVLSSSESELDSWLLSSSSELGERKSSTVSLTRPLFWLQSTLQTSLPVSPYWPGIPLHRVSTTSDSRARGERRPVSTRANLSMVSFACSRIWETRWRASTLIAWAASWRMTWRTQ